MLLRCPFKFFFGSNRANLLLNYDKQLFPCNAVVLIERPFSVWACVQRPLSLFRDLEPLTS